MERTLLGLLCVAVLVAVLTATSATQLCKPTVTIPKTTLSSIEVKWSCSNNNHEELIGFELYFKSEHMAGPINVAMNNTSLEYTLSNLIDQSQFHIFVRATHDDEDITDQSEPVQVTLARCSPKLTLKTETSSSVQVKWECKNALPEDVNDFQLQYRRLFYPLYQRMNRRLRRIPWHSVKMNSTQQEYILKELTCGASYQFFVKTMYNGIHIMDYSNLLEVRVGGPQNNPKPEDLLEVDENSVTVKLDQWKSNCLVKEFQTVLQSESGKFLYTNRTNASDERLVYPELQSNSNYKLDIGIDETWSEAVSYTFKTLCKKKVPVAPSEKEIIGSGHKYFVIYLEKWPCVDSFAVEYRLFNTETWILISNDIKPEQKSLLIQGFTLGTTYHFRINATNSAGTAVAEYTMGQDGDGCGGWTNYGNKCFKIVKEAGILTREEAQKICHKFKEGLDKPTLYTVRNKNEQWIVMSYIKVPGPIWLGLKSEDGEEFKWDDGSEVGFSSWSNKSSEGKDNRCVQMEVEYRDDLESMSPWMYESGYREPSYKTGIVTWSKVSCSKRNYVVCEKPKSRPLAEAVEEIMVHNAEMEKRIKALEKN